MSLKNLKILNFESVFNEKFVGAGTFRFYNGNGSILYNISELSNKPDILFEFGINNTNLAQIVHSLNEEIYISGILDAEGKGVFVNNMLSLEMTFKSIRKKGIKQLMNFEAVKVLSSMGGGNPIKTLGSSNFGYSQMSGRIIVNNGYLTVEGLAGEKGGKQLLVKSGLFGGVNLSVDKKTNTIKIEELVNIIAEQLKTP
jgi:hypothetical protein